MTTELVELPKADELAEALLDLAVPHEDINELLALRGRMTAAPGLRRLLERGVQEMLQDMGRIGGGGELPRMPDGSGAPARCFPVYVFVAALPYVRAYHRERSVPDDVSPYTLADQLCVRRSGTAARRPAAPYDAGARDRRPSAGRPPLVLRPRLVRALNAGPDKEKLKFLKSGHGGR